MRRTQEQILKELQECRAKEENGSWVGFRVCPKCGNDIKHTAQERFLIIRNIRNFKNKSCLKCSVTGELNPFYNKQHNKETINKISVSRKGKATGDNNAMANPKHREKVSEALKKKYASGELDYQKKIQSETTKKNHALGKILINNISKPEIELRNILESHNYKVQSQFRINSYTYDLLVNNKTIIEYNGDYFHCNPKKYDSSYYNQVKKQTASQIWNHDALKASTAIENGFKVITVWEYDFINNKKETINNLLHQL